MRNKSKLAFLSLLPIVMAVSGCSNNNPSPENQRHFHDKDESITMTNVIKDGEKSGYPAPSTGNTRVFVVPVQFTDYPGEEVGKYYNSETKDKKAWKHTDSTASGRGAENAREDIRKVFFGESSETMWHSLASYYKQASYGKLNFNGIVAPWFDAYTDYTTQKPVTAKEWAEKSSAAQLAQYILDYYSDDDMERYTIFKDDNGNTMFNSGKEFLQYFDSNGDGCFDALEMVYSAPYYATYTDSTGKDVAIDNEKFWAYCGGTGTEGNKSKPRLSKWAFQSYYTCFEGGTFDENGKWRAWTCEEISSGTAKVDGHTIIHETGHALGLPDYYDYDYKRYPIGNVDMMAYNVGDHNSYSKSLLGWVDPIVVTGPTTVTINSFTDTGDCIMVPYKTYFQDTDDKYNNTFYTEYLAIELYTPTGVNENDSKYSYQSSYPKCPTKTGIKIFHVDSRLGIYDYSSSTGKFEGYTTSIVSTGTSKYVMNANSNTGSKTVKKDDGGYQWLIEYVPNSSSNGSTITNDTLFVEGNTFGYDDEYKDYMFNSGNAFGYKFTIDSMSETSATITFLYA